MNISSYIPISVHTYFRTFGGGLFSCYVVRLVVSGLRAVILTGTFCTYSISVIVFNTFLTIRLYVVYIALIVLSLEHSGIFLMITS